MKDFNSLEELEEYLNKMGKELKSLKESIGAYKEEPKEWKPEIGEGFYIINLYGEINCWEYLGEKRDLDIFRAGNAFKTMEEAEFEVEKRKVIRELNRYSCRFKKGFEQYGITYNYDKSEVSFGYLHNVCDYATICYESQGTVQKAIKEVGEERIKKYLFGVEE
ncbi:hypothetical protein SAMN05216454_14111 [Peptostreptococcus russellii]|uniref:Uncharacterized protein n=1 Tax=Peptostreptococcus russellii TaxID=215200 RepID=A0A1H8KRU8_9FIRM|nr:hypothetical protein [Peptostreptococcus russellii]SEN95623.1 hypothetical protein SAMN05216454_14111 [Peptostreptococcus russellii]